LQARLRHTHLSGDTPQRPEEFLIKQDKIKIMNRLKWKVEARKPGSQYQFSGKSDKIKVCAGQPNL